MTNHINDGENLYGRVLARIRMDFKGIGKPGKLFFGGKDTEKVAEEIRDQQVAVFRNVPIQGISIEDIEMNTEVYTMYDEINHIEVAFAPVSMVISADTLQDILRFVAREEFRKIEILEPASIHLSKHDIERLFFRMSEEMKATRQYMERKYNGR
ncbi:hypothetical protein V6C27_07450 [Peptococcaceae bacterium 1198_IL3148]